MGFIMPVCIPITYLNNTKITGAAGVGSKDDWMAAILTTKTASGHFVVLQCLQVALGYLFVVWVFTASGAEDPFTAFHFIIIIILIQHDL
ncbi:hypothetical protein FEM48_Zijuj02G0145600 [Ziziphus jujuba var. spinosa]|uniref:Uncharacterized protein n=1 Tax=Ziziphus jujuba var. spinosa TaxID=714518 RepID=A0A978VW88_ZIZJJ|nr:hypothetical protein FEM48_Zijuj02G0145600 [Ziziphus jujuba var. spinosa]